MVGMRIGAVLVNHNTSAFAELAIRSLFVQNPGLDLSLTVYDNDSTDDRSGLLAAAAAHDVEVCRSGFPVDTAGNSHGETLSRFALETEADYLLFLDADICFTRPGTIESLVTALENTPDAFGAGPRMSWDGETEMAREMQKNPAIYRDRLHPCCALIANTPTFRAVVEHIGLSCARMLYAEREQYLDTFELMTRVMRTHGKRHVIVDDALIMHAFAVSYPDESSSLLQQKYERRDRWLKIFRDQDG